MFPFIDERVLVQDLREIGWIVNGYVDSILELDRIKTNSPLRADIKVINVGAGFYRTLGRVYTIEVEEKEGRLTPQIHIPIKMNYLSQGSKVLTDLTRIIGGTVEPYFDSYASDRYINESK